ncbi:MAG: DNA translocase FtsK [Verrucomicrobia bacterium]|nr:DNA translocase FtsK [Verrucomicrobiota bacterium]
MSARTLPRPARSRTTEAPPNTSHHAAAGFLMIGMALFWMLALLSYEPADLPGWCHLAISDHPSPILHNFIGRFGAVLAGYSFWMFGQANYLIPACLSWFGVCKLTSQSRITMRAWLGFAMMLIGGAALLHLQTIWNWNRMISPSGVGGGLGAVVGGTLLVPIMGEVGSLLALGVIYLIGFIFVTGMHPVQVLLQLKDQFAGVVRRWWARRQARKLAEEGTALLGFNEPVPAKIRRRKLVPESEDMDEDAGLELPLMPQRTPPPKIFDSSVAKPPKTQPQLSAVWKEQREEKRERAAAAPPASLTARYATYSMPRLDLLSWPDLKDRTPADEHALRETQTTIIKTLANFGINVTAGDITKGPAITRYEVYPSDGLRVSRIANLEADLARATKAERINILAPIPGKDTVGIELPNSHRIVVPIRELLEDDAFQNGKAKIPLALGKDVYGKAIIADLASMPHLLVAGATGSGKSVCINSIVTSLLCRFAPDELRFIMIDPKVVEMQGYRDLPHLALPVVTDPKQSLLALRWVVNEMEKRYHIFAEEGCRNFDTFNARDGRRKPARSTSRFGAGNEAAPEPVARVAVTKSKPSKNSDKLPHPDSLGSENVLDELDAEDGYTSAPGGIWNGSADAPPKKPLELEIPDSLPYIVVIIDELADLMQTAPADIELAICRIAQKARAAGIHLIVATQSPRADVVTGLIKANIPCRIAFQVSSALDSRVIMDRKGADKLVGKGDMLYLPPGTSQLIRAQGTMVTDDEIHGLVEHCCANGQPIFEGNLNDQESEDGEAEGNDITPEDEAILEKVLEVISAEQKASTSLIQRRLRLGYTRAARMMDILEVRGIIGPGDGAKPREILVELGG